MNETLLAFVVFGALGLGALCMFWMERRAVAKRKAEGTFVDISDIMFFGSEAALKAQNSDKAE
ncbi:hypothetical protein [Aestuariivita sp.]|jgi:hypothetical protein|uniref:hypothetical protein n=1 Tax=Aestuariivita sp. TaxID=1872407 RepID=UPI00216F6085|nr:hypothetical protein [Aestuariivita sp.]MCE8009603.1 hypothetical protein [Aestuariivita sp.]